MFIQSLLHLFAIIYNLVVGLQIMIMSYVQNALKKTLLSAIISETYLQ